MSRGHGTRGQIIPLFAISLVAMLAMGALLFDGAQALTIRRKIQDAADAAALAAANVIQSGTTRACSLTSGATPGAPRTEVVTAARNSVATNLPGYPTANVTVTCPTGWNNYAVQVSLGTTAPTFLGGVIGIRSLPVSASGTAVYGQFAGARFSVVMLDPSHPSWTKGNGCPSVLFSGGPTVTFDGSLQIDSACQVGFGGALGTNGVAATLSFATGMGTHIVGDYSPTALNITPPPLTGQPYVKDPLDGLPAITGLPTQQTKQLVLSGNTPTILNPGIYNGGIQLKNKAVAILLPGIYYLNGGGLDVGAQASVFSVKTGGTTASISTWTDTDCPSSSDCGVLIYNTGTQSTLAPITVGAGGTVMLRPYQTPATSTTPSAYRGLLFWQDRGQGCPPPPPAPQTAPPPTSICPSNSYQQPAVTLNGGGTVNLSGTVYAPSAQVFMTGGSGGSGGTPSDVALTLQFIAWDLQIQGNSKFHFYYNSDTFAQPFDYGLVQ